MVQENGAQIPQVKGSHTEDTPEWDAQGIGHHIQTLLESQSLPPMVRDQKCGQGKD